MGVHPAEGAWDGVIGAARKDFEDLARHERELAELGPLRFQDRVRQFVDDPSLHRTEPAAAVAALLRVSVDAPQGWLPDALAVEFAASLVYGFPGGGSLEKVYQSRALAVNEIRKARSPELAELRMQVLDAFDHVATRTSGDVEEARTLLGKVLAERGLVNPDPVLGERAETPAPRPGPSAVERAPRPLGRLHPGRPVGR